MSCKMFLLLFTKNNLQGVGSGCMDYRTCNWWSSDAAFVQGIHDHVGSYNDDGTQYDPHASFDKTTVISLPPGDANWADYYTKHHPPTHHRKIRPAHLL